MLEHCFLHCPWHWDFMKLVCSSRQGFIEKPEALQNEFKVCWLSILIHGALAMFYFGTLAPYELSQMWDRKNPPNQGMND